MGKVDGFYNLLPCHCHFTAIQKASLYTFCHNVLGSILIPPPFFLSRYSIYQCTCLINGLPANYWVGCCQERKGPFIVPIFEFFC